MKNKLWQFKFKRFIHSPLKSIYPNWKEYQMQNQLFVVSYLLLVAALYDHKILGMEWRGAFGSIMIIKPSLLKTDWLNFSIWNGVMGIQLIRMKYRTGPGKVWTEEKSSEGQGKSGEGLGKVQGRSKESMDKV